jgi:hypothetical protein
MYTVVISISMCELQLQTNDIVTNIQIWPRGSMSGLRGGGGPLMAHSARDI